jgi:hypothetical protein
VPDPARANQEAEADEKKTKGNEANEEFIRPDELTSEMLCSTLIQQGEISRAE